jgi:hypothetical protein
MTDALLLDGRAAAKALSISERTLFNLRKAGEVAWVQIGRAIRYPVAELKAYIERKKGK